ncbi:archaeal proteasome endopeptidase complex subunit alpha [Halobacterium litoreum]|uniref:Proteasome subunit alpha n=1 Tax=Halobacterium litoreum TaxID=2039234 RepID=A0ABD5NGH9_9EURY|nr:archaeal proteasome endopeptidase complex subunit alpha [Halobacterium litoreum]UHH13026.1 archaeal proteasome endopeptidase complex subunit alpha [Halobacterium litoreum]
MQGTDQRAYDRGTTIFSPDGRLYQVEYAREAVKQGAPVVGVRGEDSVVLAAHAAERSALAVDGDAEKVATVDGHVAVAGAGHAADTRQLVDLARQRAQQERVRYGERAPVAELGTVVADHLQEYTQTGGARPYGTALLVAGHDGAPGLVEIDPSGATREWRADAVGRNASVAREQFEDDYEEELSADGALALALAGLDAAVDDLSVADVDATLVTDDGHERVEEQRLRAVRGS